jgi:hypothetical protein
MVEHEKPNDQELVDETAAQPQDDAESSTSAKRQKGENGALWLLAGVVALAGGTLWMIRDVWLAKPVNTQVSQPAPEGLQTTPAQELATGGLPGRSDAPTQLPAAGKQSEAKQQAQAD